MFSSTLFLGLAAIAPMVFGGVLPPIWNVEVGPNGLFVYDPPYVHAEPGDIVRFRFNPKNHTVTQSAFDPPCVPLGGGVTTGFTPVAPGAEPVIKDFVVPHEHKDPIWFYCEQVGHCGAGMVFAINPPQDPHDPMSFAAFQALAIARNGTAATTTAAVAPAYTPAAYHPADAYPAEHAAPAAPVDHRVIVGADGKLEYNPAKITAAVHDTVTFEFRPKNHTVTQSSFDHPCNALVNVDGSMGIASGFMPVAADATEFPTFTITIEDTAPIWGYCGQVNHCQSGMVFSINADESSPMNFDAFRQKAIASAPTTV